MLLVQKCNTPTPDSPFKMFCFLFYLYLSTSTESLQTMKWTPLRRLFSRGERQDSHEEKEYMEQFNGFLILPVMAQPFSMLTPSFKILQELSTCLCVQLTQLTQHNTTQVNVTCQCTHLPPQASLFGVTER